MGGYFTWMTIYAVNQTMIQRYLTVKDLRFFRAKSQKNQPIKNKFWSDPLKKGKKSWSEPLKRRRKKLWSEPIKKRKKKL